MLIMRCTSWSPSPVRSRRTSQTADWTRTAGVLTAPDALHALDARDAELLLVFFDPESSAGAALLPALNGPIRTLDVEQCAELARDADPGAIMRADGRAWTERLLTTLGAETPARRSIHPKVRRVLRLLQSAGSDSDRSLEALAAAVELSPGRLMHVFTESIGIPLRPYLAWLKLQRAAAAIVSGEPLAGAAAAAGFVDAGHMSRTFRHMFGVAPSELRAAVRR
ncbi:MAG TPA: AraC family transcriptional regulator [Polyangiaceae bacterium]|nr:AraC family transcriptional regulator [Polyangiaceae bacterium]